MLTFIAAIIAGITWIYIMIASFKDGWYWPLIILFFGPIAILIYVIAVYDGNKAGVLVCYYLPAIVGLMASLLF